MSLSQQRLIGDAYPMVPLRFSLDPVGASKTNLQLPVAGHGDTLPSYWCDGYPMPFAGTIVAISYQLSAAAATGTLTVGPTVGGTEQSDPTLSITTGTDGYDTALRGLATFSAGDIVGAEVTSSADWDGTASELVVIVWVIFELSGI